MRRRTPRRFEHLFVTGIGAAVADVFHRGTVEHRGFLPNDRDIFAQRDLSYVANAGPTQRDLSLLHVIEPQQERYDGGLARARRPDKCDLLPFGDLQVEIGQRLPGTAVSEGHMIELNGSSRRSLPRFGSVGDAVSGGQSADAVLDLSDIGEDRHGDAAQTVGQHGQTRRDHGRHRDIPGRGAANAPEPERT